MAFCLATDVHLIPPPQAIMGLRILYYKITLVPIREMRDVLRITKKQLELQRNKWVRVRNGLYKGDLVQVVDVDHVRNQAKLKLKLIPRVDFQELARRQVRAPSFGRRHLLAWVSLCEKECFEFSSAILRKGGKVLLSSYGASTSTRLRAVCTFPWSSSVHHFLAYIVCF
jgi:hypothetical protein